MNGATTNGVYVRWDTPIIQLRDDQKEAVKEYAYRVLVKSQLLNEIEFHLSDELVVEVNGLEFRMGKSLREIRDKGLPECLRVLGNVV